MFTSGNTFWAGLLICLSAFSGVADSQQNTAVTTPYSKLGEYYYYKCYNITKGDLKIYEKLENDATEFRSYFLYTAEFLPDKKRTFCDSHRRALLNRIEEVSKDLKPCLYPEEKYLADFVKESFSQFLHFFCHNGGANIDRTFSANAKSCRTSLQNDNSERVGNCFSRIFGPRNNYVSKKELCDDLTTAKKCFTFILDEQCPNYRPYKDLAEEFFNYISKPCSGCISNASGMLLLVSSLLISYMFSV